jgi:hypothetical protein
MNLAPILWPVMLVWGHPQACVMICLLTYPGFWDLVLELIWLCVWGAYPIGYVPSTTWSCECSNYAKPSLPVKHKLRLLPCDLYLALNNNPNDELDKAPLCKSEGYSTASNHACFHALAVKHEMQELSTCWLEFCSCGLAIGLLLLAGEWCLASSLPFSSWFDSCLPFSSW